MVTGPGGLSLTPVANYANNINPGTRHGELHTAAMRNHQTSSDSENFTILPDAPVVTSPTATSVTSSIATLGGNVTSGGVTDLLKRGILIAPTASNLNLTLGTPGVMEVDAASLTAGVLTQNLTGLTPNTPYSFVAFATNSNGPGYSPVGTFRPTTSRPAFGRHGSHQRSTWSVTCVCLERL